MTGGGSVACPMTFVFFILMDSPMRSSPSMTGVPPDLRHNCSALSANSMSLMRTLRTLVLALRQARLKSLPSDRVRT